MEQNTNIESSVPVRIVCMIFVLVTEICQYFLIVYFNALFCKQKNFKSFENKNRSIIFYFHDTLSLPLSF